jgi:hypothetical protein
MGLVTRHPAAGPSPGEFTRRLGHRLPSHSLSGDEMIAHLSQRAPRISRDTFASRALILYHEWDTIEKVTFGRWSDDEEGESPRDSAWV